MGIKVKLIHCRSLIDDIKKLNNTDDLDGLMPHVLRSAVILFSAETEDNLKKIVAIAIKHYPFTIYNKPVSEIRKFLKSYNNNKSRNPKYSDIREIVQFFDISTKNALTEEEVQKYSNLIKHRNNVAHDPRYPLSFSFNDFKAAVEVAEKLLTYISNSLFEKVTKHIRNDFSE